LNSYIYFEMICSIYVNPGIPTNQPIIDIHDARLRHVKNVISILGSFGAIWEQKGRKGQFWDELGRICV
jgi:hypothetical protein